MKVYVVEHNGIPIDVYLHKKNAHEAAWVELDGDLNRASEYHIQAYNAEPVNGS